MKQEIQPEGNYYDKYHTKNIAEKWLMKNFFRKCSDVLKSTGLKGWAILEAGCGEGNFTRFLFDEFGGRATIEAFDISRKCIQEAKGRCPGVSFQVGSIYGMTEGGKYDLVVASEVLEHMEEPGKALDGLLGASRKYLFLTVPNEPLWRILNMARGQYWGHLGNTPGHVQHWNKRSITELISGKGGGKAEVVKITVAFPWLILLIRKI